MLEFSFDVILDLHILDILISYKHRILIIFYNRGKYITK
jgi:hypothetical protein